MTEKLQIQNEYTPEITEKALLFVGLEPGYGARAHREISRGTDSSLYS